jgi:HSP20 family protein
MEQLVEEFFPLYMMEGKVPVPEPWSPRVDVKELEKEVLIKIDLPGVEPKDVEVTVVKDVLIIKGEKKDEHEEKKGTFHRLERFVGSFYREIPLPPFTDPEKIVAASSKGVLTIHLPKKPEVQPKRIAVAVEN